MRVGYELTDIRAAIREAGKKLLAGETACPTWLQPLDSGGGAGRFGFACLPDDRQSFSTASKACPTPEKLLKAERSKENQWKVHESRKLVSRHLTSGSSPGGSSIRRGRSG